MGGGGVEDGVGVEAGEEDGRPPGQERPLQTDTEAMDMEEGQGQDEAGRP